MVDVLVVGGGGAGMAAALSAKEAGATVAVLGKSYPTRSQTCMAQGGINAALGHTGEDSVEAHIADTLKSAQGLADEAAVAALCSEGIEALHWLDAIGVPFSRNDDAQIAQRRLGGASAPRACYAQDYSGLKILHTLFDQCNRAGIPFYNERFLLDIIVEGNRACGVKVLDVRSGEVEVYMAGAVILATGGYSKLYGRHSTNAAGSSGDGHAAALRAGARLSDMEFVQFHPTGLAGSSILISESARGAGGYLLNGKGERFIDECLPRDRVARAIHDQIMAGERVTLDIRHLGEAFIDGELPQERKLAQRYEGVDPVTEPIPIKPVAHYTMGGIEVSADSQTAVAGLFAAGECANHRVHGANRLGGNSLLELIVFGRQAGANAAAAAQSGNRDAPAAAVEAPELEACFNEAPEVDFYTRRDSLATLFYEQVGLVRNAEGLQGALDAVKTMQAELPKMGVADRSGAYNTNRTDFLEFVNLLTVAEAVAEGALRREESRGAHFRGDFPEADAALAVHSLSCIKEEGLCFDFQ
ncbi:FAD-dependent oxidoreductase [Sulfurimonas diazotrophicus]|uniref:FAD-dependent oxidoreductase n=1 Tax=Sulfurimonas diazotrophicus TaxID=3131939 RepID=A0ABZ3H9P6_9BACT